MLGICVLLMFLGSGVLIAWAHLPRQSAALRVYLGLSLGMAMLMVLPSLLAFFMDFTELAQYVAMGISVLLAAMAWVFRPKKSRHVRLSFEQPDHPPMGLTLALLVPFMILCGYLLHTHIIRDVEGAMHVGQSTYGDLSLHLGIATGLRNAQFPPEYTLLPGTALGYPFLADAATTTLLLMGMPLRAAYILIGVVMLLLVGWGFIIFAWTVARDKRAVWVAFLLLFINGGLGFIYALDGWPQNLDRIKSIFTGFYLTPTNQPDLNLRWVNVLADLLIPQRTLLAGWMMVIPALLVLMRAVETRQRKLFIYLAVWAAVMPMVHTHSFLALGMISAGAMGYAIWRAAKGDRKKVLINFALYGGIAVALALPALMLWTFPQSVNGGSLRLHFNWVNCNENGLIDGYFWFWIKNMGPIYLLMVPSAIHMRRRARKIDPEAGKGAMSLAIGALLTYVIAELMLFQPNPYDNNKLFTVAFIVMVPQVARYLVGIYDRLKGLPARRLIASFFMVICLLSGALTLGREVVSDYELYSADEVSAAHYIEAKAPADAVILTGQQHNNPVSSLSGRKLVCGTPTFLYYHGLDYSQQIQAVEQMYEHPKESLALIAKYGVDYIYVSSYERSDFAIDEPALSELFPVWFENDEVTVYQVS